VGRMVSSVLLVFPGVDEEAVEAAECGEEEGGGKEGKSKVGTAGDGGDEGGGGEEEADGDLLGESKCASCDVDEEELADDEASEDEVEVDGVSVEVREKRCEGDGGEEDCGEEGRAVAMVEEVTGFEVFVMCRVHVKEARVQDAIAGVEHPDGDRHRDGGREGKMDVICRGDEPRPKSSDGGSIEGKKMPECQGASDVADCIE
jgi:hypothetical protein